jgi:hypothetical protein
MLCVTEVSPAKVAEGRTHVVDVATATELRSFKHGSVGAREGDDYSSGATASFYPAGCGSVLLSQEPPVAYLCSLAQAQPVARAALPERATAQAVSPCGALLALGGASGAVYLLSLHTGEMLWLRKAHVRAVTCVAFSHDSALLASASADATCRVTRIGGATSAASRWGEAGAMAGAGADAAVTTITGHTMAVTACAFLRFALRLVTASKDRTCRISDALTGAGIAVFTAAVPLVSVAVGPRDVVLACGTVNGGVVFFAAPAPATSAQHQAVVERECTSRAVGPFTGGAQGPVFFLATLTAAGAAQSAGAAGTDVLEPGAADEQLVAVTRDGFVLAFSWRTGAFMRDVLRVKRGVAAACVVPAKWARFAQAAVADRAQLQRSAVALKKAPVSAAGERAFVVRPLVSSAVDGAASAAGGLAAAGAPWRIRAREAEIDECGAAALESNAQWLDALALQVASRRRAELLVAANEAYAARAAATDTSVADDQ